MLNEMLMMYRRRYRCWHRFSEEWNYFYDNCPPPIPDEMTLRQLQMLTNRIDIIEAILEQNELYR